MHQKYVVNILQSAFRKASIGLVGVIQKSPHEWQVPAYANVERIVRTGHDYHMPEVNDACQDDHRELLSDASVKQVHLAADANLMGAVRVYYVSKLKFAPHGNLTFSYSLWKTTCSFSHGSWVVHEPVSFYISIIFVPELNEIRQSRTPLPLT
jgi:hypothetical protein